MYFVYLLKSQKDGKFYIGHTQNLEERLAYHNTGRSKYTRSRGPWTLMAFKTFESRGQAMSEERRIKKLKNRTAILKAFNPIVQRPGHPGSRDDRGSPEKSGLGTT